MQDTSKQVPPGNPRTEAAASEPTIPTIGELGRTIRCVRRLKGLSAEGAAETVGLTPAQFEAVEEGCGTIRVETLLAIAAALSVTFAELARAAESEASRRGERRLTLEDFEEHFGRLPFDGEG
jgi:transcriptional regulator with XRE-family HTH domain